MKLYLLTQTENRGWDTFDSCVVCAVDVKDASIIHPSISYGAEFTPDCPNWDSNDDWATSPDGVVVTYLGKADTKTKRGVILSSFNAG